MGLTEQQSKWASLCDDEGFEEFLAQKLLEDEGRRRSVFERMKQKASASNDREVERQLQRMARQVLLRPRPDPPKDHPDFDPLLHEVRTNSRFMPIVTFKDIERMANTAKELHWTDSEIKYKTGINGFGDLPEPITRTLEEILAFFGGSEAIVIENAVCQFSQEIKNYEANLFYAQQCNIEVVHSLSYKTLLDKLITSEKRRAELKSALDSHPHIRAKAEWAKKYMDPDIDIAERLVAFAAVEGIAFAGSFCYIFYVKNNYPKVCEPLIQVNELVLRDETLHYIFSCLLYTKLKKQLSADKIREILESFVKLEEKFNESILPEDVVGAEGMSGMNIHLMNEYTRFIANSIWVLLGQSGYLYPEATKCPFPFMTQLGLSHINNFFEVRDNNYIATKEMVKSPIHQLFAALGTGDLSDAREVVQREFCAKPRASLHMSTARVF